MAAIDIVVTPEKIELEGDHKRRNSTGNFSISEIGVKVLSRYLSVPKGSCHDLCKYGIKHVPGKKARNTIPKRITSRLGESQCQVKDVKLEDRKSRSVTNSKRLLDSMNRTIDKLQVIREEAPGSAKKIAVSPKHFSSPGARIEVSAKHATDLRPKHVQQKLSSVPKPGHLSSRRYSEIITSKGLGVLLESHVGGSSSRRNISINTSKEMRTPKRTMTEDLVPPTVSLSPTQSIKRELSAKSGKLKTQNSVIEAEPKQPIDEIAPEKTQFVTGNTDDVPTENGEDTTHSSQSLPPSSEEKKLEYGRNGVDNSRSPPPQSESPFSEGKKLKRGRNAMHSSRSPPSSESKKLRHSRNINHSTRSPTSLSFRKKILRRSQKEKHNAPSSSFSVSPSSHASESMGNTGSYPISEGSGIKIVKQVSNHKLKLTSSKPGRISRVNLTDKVGSPEKLIFRKGTVVDVQPKIDSPRRLRFKQRTTVVGEKQSGKADIKGRSLRKVVAVDELSTSKTESTKIVLRHQDVEGKKGGQSLLNNVIEETASKLVETRKSKVKALVGAFETVISLHDIKPSATSNAS